MRTTLGLLAAAAVGAVGAVILGEYQYKGWTVLASGVLFGLFIAEAALAVSRQASVPLGVGVAAVGVAVIGLVAMTWGAWIASGHDLSFLGPAGWVSIVVTGLVSGLRTGGVTAATLKTRSSRPGPGSSTAEPAPAAPPEDPTP